LLDLSRFARYGTKAPPLFSDGHQRERPGFTARGKCGPGASEEGCRLRVSAASSLGGARSIASSKHRQRRPRWPQAFASARSMVDNVEIAHALEYLRIPDGMVGRPQDTSPLRPQALSS